MRKLVKAIVTFFTSLDKNLKSTVLASLDSLIIFLSWCLFFPLPAIIVTNYEFELSYYFLQQYSLSFLVSLLCYLMLMHFLRGFREIVRSFTIDNLFPITIASSCYVIVLTILNGFQASDTQQFYINFIQSASAGTISFSIIVFSRLAFRFLASSQKAKKTQKVFIYGTGNSARELYGSLTYDSQKQILGFISSDENLIGRELLGKMIYSLSQTSKELQNNKNIQLYLASRTINEEDKAKVIDLCVSLGVKVKQISSYSDMLKEKEVNLTDLNISDLLPRNNMDEISSDMEKLNDKIILISGAGGSIGSEIARKVSQHTACKKLILLDISESSLFSISEELKDLNKKIEIISVILDVKNKNISEKLFAEYKPNIVYHAAAYKHVPILEEKYNALQAIDNNFFGTCAIAEISIKYNVEKFVFISTDKAVRPTNIMGSSKRMAELYIQALNKKSNTTSLISVRFGNVIDSSGSVVPTFRKQIKNGGPVTVTHPEIIRYFMTIGEAAYLVIISSLISDSPGVYMLKMGEPVKILDIAKRMIKLSGNEIKTENVDGIEIIFSGLRSGEKLYEELLVNDNDIKTDHPKIFIDTSSNDIDLDDLKNIKDKLSASLESNSIQELKDILRKYADYN